MKRNLTKCIIDGTIYLRIAHLTEDNKPININIYEKINHNYKEVTPGEIFPTIRTELSKNSNYIQISKEETLRIDKSLKALRDLGEKAITLLLKEKSNDKIVFMGEAIGIEYVFVSSEDKPYYTIFRVLIGDKGEIRGMSLVGHKYIEYVCNSIINKIDKELIHIHVFDNVFYSVKKNDGYCIISQVEIQSDKNKIVSRVSMNKATIVKENKLININELSNKRKDKIIKEAKEICKDLIKCLELNI